MSETILNENFPDNGRINVKEYFFKVVRYIGLFAALTIITGVFFTCLNLITNSGTEKARLLSVCASSGS